MGPLRRLSAAALIALALAAAACGCGGEAGSEQAAWREEVDASLDGLRQEEAYRYRIHLQTWIGVSGQSVYGDERGEGSFRGGDLSLSITRTSPEGEQSFALARVKSGYFLQEGDAWRAATDAEIPGPLYDPSQVLELASSYTAAALEGEEVLAGVACKRYLLQLDGGKARSALSERAWSYFSSLDYELSCRVWIGEASAPPVSLRLEVSGSDPQERLQRYRAVVTIDPYDFGSPHIQTPGPGA